MINSQSIETASGHRYLEDVSVNRTGSAQARLMSIAMLLFPLTIFAIYVGGYPVSMTFLFLILTASVLVLETVMLRRIRSIFTIPMAAFMFWVLCSAVFASSLNSVIGAIVMCLYLLLFCGSGWTVHTNIARHFTYSLFISIPFALFDLARSFVNLPTLSEILHLGGTQSTYTVGNLYRVMSTFSEPSNYAIYLAFIIIINDIANEGAIYKVIKTLALFVMLLTFSTSGITIILLYYVLRSLLKLRVRRLYTLAIILIILSTTYYVPLSLDSSDTNPLIDYINKRALNIGNAFDPNTSYSTSESTRLGAITVVKTYVSMEGWIKALLFAEGFNNYSEWLAFEASGPQNSSFERGTVQNAFTAIALGSGIVGLLLYLANIFAIFKYVLARYKPSWALPAICAWLCANFANGQIIVYPLLGYLLLIVIALSESKRTYNDK